jgi:hypothetical protein
MVATVFESGCRRVFSSSALIPMGLGKAFPENFIGGFSGFQSPESNCYKTPSSRARKCRPVQHLVAVSAQCDQVGLRVVTEGASPSHVVNVEIP